jgi:hypothetical protein
MLKFAFIFCIVTTTMKNTIAIRIFNRNVFNLAIGRMGLYLLNTEREGLIISEEFCLLGYNVVQFIESHVSWLSMDYTALCPGRQNSP